MERELHTPTPPTHQMQIIEDIMRHYRNIYGYASLAPIGLRFESEDENEDELEGDLDNLFNSHENDLANPPNP